MASTCQKLDLLVNALAQNKSRRVSDKLAQSEAGAGVGGCSGAPVRRDQAQFPVPPVLPPLPSDGLYKPQKFTCVENGSRTDSLGRQGFPGVPLAKNLPANAGDMGLIPDQARSYMPRSN